MARIIKDMSNRAYHAEASISRSQLAYIDNPLKYWNKYVRPSDYVEEPSEALHNGNAGHTKVLEPHLFDSMVIKTGTKSWDTKETQALIHDNPDKYIVTEKFYNSLSKMGEAVQRHDTATEILSEDGDIEVSVFVKCPNTGLNLKCRFDKLMINRPRAVDYKTTTGATHLAFGTSVRKFGYHYQDAFYSYVYELAFGRTLDEFIFIAQEKTSPFSIGCYYLSQDDRDEGRALLIERLKRLRYCTDNDFWPDINGGKLVELNAYTSKRR